MSLTLTKRKQNIKGTKVRLTLCGDSIAKEFASDFFGRKKLIQVYRSLLSTLSISFRDYLLHIEVMQALLTNSNFFQFRVKAHSDLMEYAVCQ